MGKTHLHTGSFFIFKIFSYGSSYKPVKLHWILIPTQHKQQLHSQGRQFWVRSGSEHWLLRSLQRLMKVPEGIYLNGRGAVTTCSCLLWNEIRAGYADFCPLPVFLQQVEEPCKAEDQCYRTVLLPQLFSIDQASAMHKTEKPVLFPLRQEVYCFTLEFVCLLSDSWGILSIHGSFKALLPAACRFWFTYISAWSDFARDPHWLQLAVAASKTCSRLILLSLVLQYCKIL